MQIYVKQQKSKNPKTRKQNRIIAGLVVAIIAVSIFIAVMIGNFVGKEPDTTSESTSESTTLAEVVIPNETEESETEETKVNESEVLVLQEPTQQTVTNSEKPDNTGSNTVKPAESVNPSSPSGTVQGSDNGGVIDDGNDSVNEYSCGVKGHHCDSKETHDFIVSLENKGCPYCGSHSCKSFYTYDEWGNACYDPTKCESYSAKENPAEYCQDCGKKLGDGNGNTCIQFTVDFTCSDCGKKVSAWTCHSH